MISDNKKKILIVNVNWVGDVLFSTPFIRSVRDAFPDSHIACLIHPRCVEMLELNPALNEIIKYDEELTHRGFIGKIKLIADLRKRKFDKVFILHRSFTKALIAYLANIPERVGYPTKNRAMILTKSVEEPIEEIHKVEYFLNLARACGINSWDDRYEFFISESDRIYVNGFLSGSGIPEGGKFAAICPGGNWAPKRWPKQNFAKLCDFLIEKLGLDVVICGAIKDEGLASDIAAAMKNKPVIACGKTTLKQLGAILERSSVVIANDTGPMHIASAVGANLIALFGPTSPVLTGPYGKGRVVVIAKHEGCEIPCYDFTCKDYRCMSAISVEDVCNEAKKIVEG